MNRRMVWICGLLTAVAFSGFWLWPRPVPTAAVAPTLTDAEFDSILKTVLPAPGEDPFAQIPWQTSLWEARQLAAKEGKPILLWEMDGHPLGCG